MGLTLAQSVSHHAAPWAGATGRVSQRSFGGMPPYEDDGGSAVGGGSPRTSGTTGSRADTSSTVAPGPPDIATRCRSLQPRRRSLGRPSGPSRAPTGPSRAPTGHFSAQVSVMRASRESALWPGHTSGIGTSVPDCTALREFYHPDPPTKDL